MEPNLGQNIFDVEQQKQLNELRRDLHSQEFVYYEEFKVQNEEGEEPLSPISIFFKAFEAMPNWLKKFIDRQNHTKSYMIGDEEFRVKKELKIGDFRISGFSKDRISIYGEDHQHKTSGYIATDPGRVSEDGERIREDSVHVGLRVYVKGPAGMAVFIIKPLVTMILRKIIQKVLKENTAKEDKTA